MPTPPPYVGITGIYTVDDKHQEVTKAAYDGSARPGQLVVDTSDYSLWIGDDTGALNSVGGGGTSNKIQNVNSKVEIPSASGDVEVTVNSVNVMNFTTSGIDYQGDLYIAANGGVGVGTVIENDGGDLEIKNFDDDIIIDTRNGGDDIFLYAGDRVRAYGGDRANDSELDGGDIELNGGRGADNTSGGFAGAGGDIFLTAGDAGTASPGTNSTGGNIEINGGYTSLSATSGGYVHIKGGASTDAVSGEVYIGLNRVWTFNSNYFYFRYPVCPQLALLGPATGIAGARAFISDSSVAASGNFGAIAAGGGANTVPVFSDGANWLIG